MTILTFPSTPHSVWNRTRLVQPPVGEILSACRSIHRNGPLSYEDAIWDGKYWTRLERGGFTQETCLPLAHYDTWRRYDV